jgi:hypothetical protein
MMTDHDGAYLSSVVHQRYYCDRKICYMSSSLPSMSVSDLVTHIRVAGHKPALTNDTLLHYTTLQPWLTGKCNVLG